MLAYLTRQVDATDEKVGWITVQHADMEVQTLKENDCSSRNLSWKPEFCTCLLDFGGVKLEQPGSLLELDCMSLACS